MNKFNQVRKQKNADNKQAEMFADTMDMIARERAVLRLFSGNKSLQVHNLSHAVSLINKQLEHEYDDMIKNMASEELHILHDGIKVLIYLWEYQNDIETAKQKAMRQVESEYESKYGVSTDKTERINQAWSNLLKGL